MDIVDAQIHANVLPVETVLAMMDAVGIWSALIDEYDGVAEDGALLPCYRLSGGITRPVGPLAESASLRHPERFSHLVRINPLDPDLAAWVQALSASPGLRALRVVLFTDAEMDALAEGRCDRLFTAAQRHGLPVFVFCPANLSLLVPDVERFPDVQFVVDHCGVRFDMAPGAATLEAALAMAAYPNVALKWAHVPGFLSREPYPFSDLDEKLSKVVEAFGPERVMWASDFTVTRHRQTWAESLFSIRHCQALSASDRDWILGRTVRTLLKWPAPAKPPQVRYHTHGASVPAPATGAATEG